jgi:hypothetical protein
MPLPSTSTQDAASKPERKNRSTTSSKGGRKSPYRRPPGCPTTHGAAMLTRVLRTASIDSIDGRSQLGVALRRIRDDLTDQLGNPTAAEKLLIAETAKSAIIAAAVGDYCLRQESLIGKDHALLPCVEAHGRLVANLGRLLGTLGPRRTPADGERDVALQAQDHHAARRS